MLQPYMSTTIIKSEIANTPDNWEKTSFSSDDMWQAFQRGEQYQINKQEQEFNETLTKNLNRAAFLSEGIFHTAINDYNVGIQKAYLKAETIENFDVLFLVNLDDFMSEKIKDIYKRSHLVKSEFNGADFHISFKFMPSSDSLNLDSISSDGYMLEYGKGKQRPA
jgi:hypothetical protein